MKPKGRSNLEKYFVVDYKGRNLISYKIQILQNKGVSGKIVVFASSDNLQLNCST